MSLFQFNYKLALKLIDRYPNDDDIRQFVNDSRNHLDWANSFKGETAQLKSDLGKARSENDFLIQYINKLEHGTKDDT